VRTAYGNTRFVILSGTRAIKIARPRPLFALSRIWQIISQPERREHFRERYAKSSPHSVWRDFWIGVGINRNEYDYYQRSHDPRVMPTEHLLLSGFIIIQLRGEPIVDIDLIEPPHHDEKFQEEIREIFSIRQYQRNPKTGCVVLVDYGRPRLIEFLEETLTTTQTAK
jgi:hypothetical protein